jgi:hypothetical protein
LHCLCDLAMLAMYRPAADATRDVGDASTGAAVVATSSDAAAGAAAQRQAL